MNRLTIRLIILVAAALAACTSTKPHAENQRAPSSLVDHARVDGALSDIAGQLPARNEIESLLLAISRIHFRGQDFLAEFDRELESKKTPNMMTSDVYARLQSVRLLKETAAHRIVSRYEDLLTRYWEAVEKKTSVSEIQAQLNEIRRTINQPIFMTGGHRIALQDLATELNDAPSRTFAEYYGSQLKETADVAAMQGFASFLFKNQKDYEAFVQDSTVKADIQAKVAEALSDRVVLRNVQLIAPFMQLELQANLESRKPQAHSPSTGAHGNMNGSNFPRNTWALTFDDGPSAHTLPIVANLKDHGIKATFFWLARMVTAKGASRYVSAAKAAGMDLNNHSYTHANLANLGAAGLQREIAASTAVETQAYGTRPRFFRCPYGSGVSTGRVRAMIADQQMIHVFWNVDSLDWQDHNVGSIVRRVQNQMANEGRGIILFHDIHARSVVASNIIMGDLAKKRAVTMTQITNELNGR